MHLKPIPVDQFSIQPYDLFANHWFVLTAGDFLGGQYNAMTISWGSMGHLWDKPFVQIVVRPSRYTFEFIEKFGSFTLSAFPPKFKPVLNLLGSKSGRNHDKIKQSGLTVIASKVVSAPSFQQAELIIECDKMYWDDLKPGHFLDPETESIYPQKDYHRMYFGKIVSIQGIETYEKSQ